jgi:hypothetical protein
MQQGNSACRGGAECSEPKCGLPPGGGYRVGAPGGRRDLWRRPLGDWDGAMQDAASRHFGELGLEDGPEC